MTQASVKQASPVDRPRSQPATLPNLDAVPVVNSHNEWDLLEGDIVGRAGNALGSEWHLV